MARSRHSDTTLQRHVSFFDDDGDTRILDEDGRFDAGRFRKVFGTGSSVDRNGDRAFTAAELTRMINANRETLAGYVAATAEWRLLLALAADTSAIEGGRKVPALSVARLKSFYDGTLFYQLAKEHARDDRRVGRRVPGSSR